MVLWAVHEAVSTVTLNPDPGNLPGGAVLQQLTNGLGGWALIMALVGTGDRCRRMGARGPFAELSPVLQRTEDRPRLRRRRLVDRRGTGDRQFLLPRRAGGALTVLEAFPLCPGVVPVVGNLCNTVSGAAGNVAGSAAGAGIGAIFTEAARWVASGAVWLIAQVGRAMSGTTSIDLDAGWFTAHEAVMASLAAAVVLPMACCAAIQAIYRQSASTLLRTFLVHLPLSLLLTGVAVTLVRMALAVTDAMSATVLSSAGVDTTNLFTGLFKFLVPSAVTQRAVPGFVVFLGSLFVALAALTLWLELVVRAAAVSVAVLFFPWRWPRSSGPRSRTGAGDWLTPSSPWCSRSSSWRRSLSLAAGGGRRWAGGVEQRQRRSIRLGGDGDRSAPDRHPGAVHLAPAGAGGRSGSGRPSRVDAPSPEERRGHAVHSDRNLAVDLAKRSGPASDRWRARWDDTSGVARWRRGVVGAAGTGGPGGLVGSLVTGGDAVG